MPNFFADSAKISEWTDIEESSKGSVLSVGEDTVIDSFVKIKFAGGIGNIKIGEKCYINSGCVLYSGNGITIGKNVIIAANCTLAPVNHEFRNLEIPIREQGFLKSRGGIIIEDDVWIGAGSVILDGTHILKGSVIGAMSLTRGKLLSCSVYAGNPVKFIKKRTA